MGCVREGRGGGGGGQDNMGNFRVVFCLFFKASPSAMPFMWKLVLFIYGEPKFACE